MSIPALGAGLLTPPPKYHKPLPTVLIAMALVVASLGFAPNAASAQGFQKPAADKPPPPQPKKMMPEAVRERWARLRRSLATDEELRKQLLQATRVDMSDIQGTKTKVINVSAQKAASGADTVPLLVASRSDLIGLPLRPPMQRRLSKEEAINLQVQSQQLRLHIEKSIPGITDEVLDLRPDADVLRKRLLGNPLQDAWLRPEAILPLRQLLMHEHRNVRHILVDVLAKIKGPQASVALAERALFDLNAEVRLAAVVALLDRPVFEYEDVLIAGLRYPWAAAADHAAEALVALNLRGAVPKLVPLLDARPLDEPYLVESGQARAPVLPELVRINHHRNCLLCHATSFSPADPVRGLVPNAEQRLPLPSQSKYPQSVKVSTWVRADITFFKQDFTVVQPVPNHGKRWPADQRFDYMVRLRPLSDHELHLWQEKVRDFRAPPQQRESVMFALRELTGENPGPQADDWKRLYSPITGQRLKQPLEAKDHARHLCEWLVDAPPLKQAEVLASFKERSGPVYDVAVATAIPQLKSEVQKLARAALENRFYCLSADALRQRLGSEEAEIRRAAVQVCGQRKLKDLATELIGLIDDADPAVASRAHKCLVQFAAGKDFGPRGASNTERERAMAAWREWHAEREKKQKEPKGAGP